jgi:ASC-1-like (ASCH) protein
MPKPRPQPPQTALEIHCREPWFTHLFSGTKTVEGRLNKEPYNRLVPGDRVTVVRNGESIYCVMTVVSVRVYPGSPTVLEDYLTNETLARTLPRVGSIAEGVAIYRKFYTQGELETCGMVAIGLRF